MAVTLTTTDLEQPVGELSNNFFPQGDLATHLLHWLAAAKSKVEADTRIDASRHNDAAAAWVYYRAYDYIANQFAALPSSASEGDGAIQVSYAVTQFRYYRDLASAKLAEYNVLPTSTATLAGIFTLAQGRRGL